MSAPKMVTVPVTWMHLKVSSTAYMGPVPVGTVYQVGMVGQEVWLARGTTGIACNESAVTKEDAMVLLETAILKACAPAEEPAPAVPSAEQMPEIDTVWTHYKGVEYVVVGSCFIEATFQNTVLYKTYRKVGPTWARPLADWHAQVPGHGPRFRPGFAPAEAAHG